MLLSSGVWIPGAGSDEDAVRAARVHLVDLDGDDVGSADEVRTVRRYDSEHLLRVVDRPARCDRFPVGSLADLEPADPGTVEPIAGTVVDDLIDGDRDIPSRRTVVLEFFAEVISDVVGGVVAVEQRRLDSRRRE